MSMEIVGIGVVLFVATNLDDIFLLIAFLADPALKPRQVAAGQYFGIAALYAVSVVASQLSLVIPEMYIGLLGLIPIAIGAFSLRAAWRGVADEEPLPVSRGGVFAVAAITVASGGDNIAVYTPVFAVHPMGDVFMIGLVFAVMVALWVAAAYWLIRHPSLGAPLRRYGHRAVPFVLIAIGVLVMVEARSFRLLL